MDKNEIWLGYEGFKQDLEPLRQCAYVVVEEPAREAVVIEKVLSEIALQRQSEGQVYFIRKDLERSGRYEVAAVPAGRADDFEKAWRTLLQRFLQKRSEEDLTEELDLFRQAWPEQVAFATALVDQLLRELKEEQETLAVRWLPQRLSAAPCPVVWCTDLRHLTGYEEEDQSWHPGDLEKALGGFLLLPAKQLYDDPDSWQLLCDVLTGREGQISLPSAALPQVILYGSAWLYEQWRQDSLDFASFFSEVRMFPSQVPNGGAYRAEWFEYIRQSLDQLITDRALEFLLSLVSGLSPESIEDGDGFLPGRLTAADPWIEECRWICQEKGTNLINIAIVKQVWQNRQRRLQQLHRLLYAAGCQPGSSPLSGRRIGSVYSVALCDLKYCFSGELVHVTANAEEKRRAKKSGWKRGKSSQEKQTPKSAGASAAVILAMLSAWGGYPIRQNIAVMGNVDKSGHFQPVDRASELVTSFYEICQREGCESGGLMLPAANMLHLDLPANVQKALQEKRFFLYPVQTLMEGAEILMKRF